MRRDSSFCAKSVRYNIFTNGAPQASATVLVCVVVNNSSCPTVKNNNTAYHAFGKY